MMEQTLMLVEGWQEPGLIRWIAHGDDLPGNDQAAVHFGLVYLVTELRVVWWGFATTDNLRMRLDETHDFLGRRNTFTLPHTPFRLLNALLDQRHPLIELLAQSLGRCGGRIAQGFGHCTALRQGGAGNGQEFGIRSIYGFF